MYSKGLRSEMLRSHAVASHIVIIGVYFFFFCFFLLRFKQAALVYKEIQESCVAVNRQHVY